ncbi:MAG: leader peptide processing enzyme [Treponema sp.]|jgi:hypothetical protein|nr:leader peptide processing enzyme [Treponema sp.]
MNKKTNTILFILGATLFNVIVCIAGFLILFFLYARFIHPILPEGGQSWSFSLIFIGAIAISILVYRVVLKALLKKIDVEKYFDPIFSRGKSVKKN